MNIFDRMSNRYFQKDDEGNTIFYPWGPAGSGVIVGSKEKENQIRGYYKLLNMLLIIGGIIVMVVLGGVAAMGYIMLMLIIYFLTLKGAISDLEKSSRKYQK